MFGVDKRGVAQLVVPLVLIVFVLVFLLSLTGCENFRVQQQYVTADRATFDVVAPVVRVLADDDPENDPDLSGVNGKAVLLMLDTWEIRLKSAEGGDQ